MIYLVTFRFGDLEGRNYYLVEPGRHDLLFEKVSDFLDEDGVLLSIEPIEVFDLSTEEL